VGVSTQIGADCAENSAGFEACVNGCKSACYTLSNQESGRVDLKIRQLLLAGLVQRGLTS